MKKRILLVILGIGIPLYLLYHSGWADNLLALFGLSSISVLLYLLKVIFDDQINTGIKKSLAFLGIKKKEEFTIDPILTENAQNTLLQRLKTDVHNLCSKNLALIEKSELKFIKTLNWKVTSINGDSKIVQGRLHDLIKKTQSFNGQSFAIIGPAGVGKTSAIFDYIAHQLKEEKIDLVPVYFSLSSWKKDQTVKEWLQQELDKLYRIDAKNADYFIRAHKMVPFLDGLDQMTQEMRERCILEINEYARINPVTLISRPKVFFEIATYLEKKDLDIKQTFRVYELQPLSPEQVEAITNNLDTRDRFKEIFEKSSKLKSFARYPMALFLLAVTIRDIDATEIEKLETGSDIDIFSKLWQKYDAFVLENTAFLSQRKVTSGPNAIRNWLQSIARQEEHSFFIEELQPLFLSSKRMRLHYYILSRILMAFFISIAVGFFMSGPFDFLNAAIISGFTATLVIYLFRTKRKTATKTGNVYEVLHSTSTRIKLRHYLSNILWFLVPMVFILWAYYGFSSPRNNALEKEMFLNGLFSTTEANVGVLIGILMALIFGFRARWQQINLDIRSVEKLSRNAKGFFRYGTVGGIILGLLLNILSFVITNLVGSSGFGLWLEEKLYIDNVYLLSFFFGFIFGFILFGIMGYLKDSETLIDKKIKKEHTFKPNFGIKRSLLNATRAGVIVGVVMCIVLGSSIGILENELTSIIKAIKAGIAFGILAFLWFGGLDVISHYSLRLLIWLDNSGPINYIRFLEESSNLRFIRVVGAGYEFTHPTLKHYFNTASFTPLKHKKMKRSLITLFFVLLTIPVAASLYLRLTNQSFWEDKHGFEITSYSPFVTKVPDTKNEWKVTGIPDSTLLSLNISAKGKVKLGTFTGFNTASGTEAGIFGMGIGDVYDLQELQSFHHGAVSIQQKSNNKWRPFPEEDIYGILNNDRNLWVTVKNEERIKFVVNDSEWQNNQGKYTITIDTLKTTLKMETIAHRGAAALAPENTLEAVRKALTLSVDKIEVDVHQSKDGVMVVMHDKKVKRTTNGKGKIGALSFKKIKQLEIDHDFAEFNTPIRVPSLEEVLLLVKESDTKLLIEVKNTKAYPQIGATLADLLEKHNMSEKVEVFSFDKKFIKDFKSTYPIYRTGLFVLSPLSDSDVPGIETVGVYYHSLIWFPSYKKKLQKRGLKVYAWTVNSEKSMQRLIEMNVDGIITDKPNILLANTGKE